MLHRLCGPPSIPLSFTYSPGGALNAFAAEMNATTHLLVHIVYGVDYQGI